MDSSARITISMRELGRIKVIPIILGPFRFREMLGTH
ncbi:hypothetical protein JOE11_004462 [Robbsia andropogonis]